MFSVSDVTAQAECAKVEMRGAAEGVSTEHLFAVMDELMTTIQILQPRLYDGVMRKLTTEY